MPSSDSYRESTPDIDGEGAEPSAAIDSAVADAAKPHPPEPALKRVVVIVAHPDDAEFLCAGTVAKWASEGHDVTYVLLTSGDKGSSDPAVSPEQLIATREVEQRDACAALGVKDVQFLRYPDASLVPDLALRRDLTRVIRRIRPDVVICQDPTVPWVGQSYLNHPDHRAAGQATLDAVYPAARDRMTYPELLAEGLEPHKVREVYLGGAKEPDVWIDITKSLPKKLEALRCHVSQMNGWDPEEMIRQWAREEAEKHPGNGEYVEGFKYFELE
jgi:LmbE family N-acetylglucosaminyl deacetylase